MPQRICQKSAIAITIFGFFSVLVWLDARPALADYPPTASPDGAWQTVVVNKGFDSAKFDYQIRFRSQRNGYRVYKIKYPSPVKTALEQNNTVMADYYLPNDIAREIISCRAERGGLP